MLFRQMMNGRAQADTLGSTIKPAKRPDLSPGHTTPLPTTSGGPML